MITRQEALALLEILGESPVIAPKVKDMLNEMSFCIDAETIGLHLWDAAGRLQAGGGVHAGHPAGQGRRRLSAGDHARLRRAADRVGGGRRVPTQQPDPVLRQLPRGVFRRGSHRGGGSADLRSQAAHGVTAARM